jgi:hypothetical protein
MGCEHEACSPVLFRQLTESAAEDHTKPKIEPSSGVEGTTLQLNVKPRLTPVVLNKIFDKSVRLV